MFYQRMKNLIMIRKFEINQKITHLKHLNKSNPNLILIDINQKKNLLILIKLEI